MTSSSRSRMRQSASFIFCAILIAALTACDRSQPIGSPTETAPTARRQAILILLDAARGDRFGYAGYQRDTTPNIDALAESGVVFLNHFAHDTATRPSLPNLFYSRYFVRPIFPASDRVPLASPRRLMRRLDDEAISLPRVLQMAGLRTAAISAHSWIRADTDFGREFEEVQELSEIYDDPVPDAALVFKHATQWISEHINEDYFLYLHFMDTHFPHKFGPEARAFYGDGEYRGRFIEEPADEAVLAKALDGDERRHLDARYDGSLLRVDRELGRLFAFLKAMGVLADTLIVITSDHGEHLLEVPQRFSHGGPWLDRVAHIPLVISYPSRLTPGRVEDLTGLVDVFPTMIGLLNAPLPEGKQAVGTDLFAKERASQTRVLSRHGIRTSRHKLILADQQFEKIFQTDAGWKDLSGSLYDLLEDPDEVRDLWPESKDLVNSLLGEYRQALRDKHNRYVNAKTDTPPDSPFAIGSASFEYNDETRIATISSPSEAAAAKISNPWIRSISWGNAWLFGRRGADPITLSFFLPSGRYEVVANVEGAGTITLGEKRPVTVAWSDRGRRPTRVGTIDIKNQRFIATIEPAAQADFLVEWFGFRPLPSGAPAAAPAQNEARYNERLRALGYIR